MKIQQKIVEMPAVSAMVLDGPTTREVLETLGSGTQHFEVIVGVDFNNLLSADFDTAMNMINEAVVSDVSIMDINFDLVGVQENLVFLQVTALIDTDDDEG